jgi:hypothetical protein
VVALSNSQKALHAPHTIEASEKPILDIFCDKYLFRIPAYQRPYAWAKEQTSELLDDVITACSDSGEVVNASPYFLGSVVLIKDPHGVEADIVDGQQRLTTLTILLCVLRDLSESTISAAIHKYICQTGEPIGGTSDVFRLTPRERDADFFRVTIQTQGGTAGLPDAQQFRDARADGRKCGVSARAPKRPFRRSATASDDVYCSALLPRLRTH